jgi:hypothetical protein
MFGHNDDQQAIQSQGNTDEPAASAPVVAADGSLGSDTSTVVTPTATVPTATAAAKTEGLDLQLPSSLTSAAPSADLTAAPTPAASVPAAPDDLLTIKQEALQQLSPLVSHLDQTPEERFRTTMMMIQATDDHTKIAEAYEAAKAITDDKTRAQALLDVVNEINYFTQQHQEQPTEQAL